MSSLTDSAEQILLTPTQFVAAVREHERQAALLALALRRLETSGEYAADGAVSLGAWLRDQCRMTNRQTAAWIAHGRFLDRYSAVAEAEASGVLSHGQVDVMRRRCPSKLRQILDEQQHDMVANLSTRDIAETELFCRLWQQRAEAEVAETEPPAEPDRALHVTQADDGAFLLNGVLGEAAGVQLEQALNLADTWEGPDDTRTRPQRNADSLDDIIGFFLRNHDRNETKRRRPHVDLSIDLSTLGGHLEAVTGAGRLLHHCTTEAFLCDCILHKVIRDDQALPTSYGRATYTVPAHLFRQVAARDGGCRYPGCHRPVNSTEAHHIHSWEHGGSTDLDNLVLLCSRHH
ncbi:MAG: DUF222 domain-containing protein, partial [Actinomycetota bacterium]